MAINQAGKRLLLVFALSLAGCVTTKAAPPPPPPEPQACSAITARYTAQDFQLVNAKPFPTGTVIIWMASRTKAVQIDFVAPKDVADNPDVAWMDECSANAVLFKVMIQEVDLPQPM